MIRLFKHCLGILFGIALLLLMINIHLSEIPYLQTTLTVLICISLFLFGILVYSRCFKKGKKFILLLGIMLINFSAFSQSVTGYIDQSAYSAYTRAGASLRTCSSVNFCDSAKKYDRHNFKSKRKDWKNDKSCEEYFGGVFKNDHVRKCAREKLNELKTAPSVFVRRDKLTAQQQENYRSFMEDSHWNEWVNENFSDIANVTERQEMACASFLAGLCSAYEERHPPDRGMTVKEIMEKDAKNASCWPCEMAYIILTVVQSLSSKLSEEMRIAGLNLLKILMLFWILYAVFQALLFPSKGAEFIKNLMLRFLCVIIAAIILAGQNNLQSFYKSFLTPVIGMGLGLSEAIDKSINSTSAFSSASSFSENIYTKNVGTISGRDYCASTLSVSATGTNPWAQLMGNIFPYLTQQYPGLQLDANNTLITPELESNLLCMTQNMYRQTSPITAVGQSLISFSFDGGTTQWSFFWQDFKMVCVGGIIVFCFSIFSFLVAFKIIDIFLRLGFVLVLMPIFVATAVFPVTRDFTVKAFLFLLNIVTEFLGLALAINFIIIMFGTGLGMNSEKLSTAMLAPYSKEYGANLLNAVISNNGWFLLFFMIALFFMGNQLLQTSSQIVNTIFGTKTLAGNTVGGAVTHAIKLAGKATKETWDISSRVADVTEKYTGPNALTSRSSSKRYFGQKTGDAVNSASQKTAMLIDKIGVGAGQALSRTGIGAIAGVPLTIASKTLSLGVRAVGKTASVAMKAPGKTVSAIGSGAKKIGSFFKKKPSGGP